MMNAFMTGILSFVIHLIEVVLAPIDSAISANVPQLSSALGAFGDLIDYVISFLAYAVDLTGLSSFALNLVVAYMTFALTVPIIVWVIKVVVKWWHALVP